MKCLPTEQWDAVWEIVSTALENFCSKDQQEGPSGVQCRVRSDDNSEPKAKKAKMTLLLTDSDSDASDEERDVSHAWTADLARYNDEDPLPETEKPLNWWKLNSHRFPVLASFVKTVLCVPATSVPCERLFSSSGYIVNKTRAALFPKMWHHLFVCMIGWKPEMCVNWLHSVQVGLYVFNFYER